MTYEKQTITIDLNNRDYAFLGDSSNLQVNAFEKVKHIINDILAHNDEKNGADLFKDFKYQSKIMLFIFRVQEVRVKQPS